jgi:signal transduction histidine kinase
LLYPEIKSYNGQVMSRTELLREYAAFLKRNYFAQLEEENRNYLDRLGLPLQRLYKHVSVDKLQELNKENLSTLLSTLEKVDLEPETAATLLEKEIQDLREMANEDLEPGGLLKLYTARKQAMFRFIPEFTTDTKTMQTLVEEIEHTFLGWQDATVQVYFQYRTEVAREQAAAQAREETSRQFIEKLSELNKDLRSRQQELLVYQKHLLTKQDEVLLLNEDLTTKETELLRSNEALKHFASIASHDLKEPLRTVKQYVQLLARRYKGKLDNDADEFIEFAVDGTKRMENLIQSLLDYAKLQNPDTPVEATDLEFVLENAMKNLTVAISESKAEISSGKLPMAKINKTQITQIFQNLLSNAIKYRQPGKAPRIRIEAEKKDREWVISVSDNGIGINADYFEKVFQPFQRLHSWDEYEGVGLGMSFCKKIIEQYGGKMWVESVPPEGSTFFFTLPY